MTAKYVQAGKSIEITAAANVSAGDVVVIGGFVGVAPYDITSGGKGTVDIEGVFEFPKESALVISAGADVFWNPTSSYATTSSGGSNVKCGKAVELSGASVTVVNVKLD